MRTPAQEHQQSREVLLTTAEITRLQGEQDPSVTTQLAHIHTQEWGRIGLCTDPEAPESQAARFDADETYVVMDQDSGEIYAQINTLPADVRSTADLIAQHPTYRSVVDASIARRKPTNPNVRLCFSITARNDKPFKIQTADGPKSVAGELLHTFDAGEGVNKLAYSRFGHIEGHGDQPLDAVYMQTLLANSAEDKATREAARIERGAVGMHEHLGALTIGIIKESRPEDEKSGHANALVLYPKTPEEAAHFKQIMEDRINNGVSPFEETDTAFIATDFDLSMLER